MSKSHIFKSDVKKSVHEIATALRNAAMLDRQTMLRFDESCLTPEHEFSAEEIRAFGERDEEITPGN